ncbi:hypothetical protein AVEN_161285-1 [Araneus ventricosus]|uniref:Secreted protein n=1 Tax=Araneus ventricosus TaxID=182803 RepID=A0A4Y2W7B9_ARAVE|nr:hypothetical protein AVEN_161285-1 [Araneus ventricosus]
MPVSVIVSSWRFLTGLAFVGKTVCSLNSDVLFQWPVVRHSWLEVPLISRRGTAKHRCCSRICGVTRTFRRNVGKCSDIKGSESMDGDLGIVPTGCFRLCMCLQNGAACRTRIRNKSPTTDMNTKNH